MVVCEGWVPGQECLLLTSSHRANNRWLCGVIDCPGAADPVLKEIVTDAAVLGADILS